MTPSEWRRSCEPKLSLAALAEQLGVVGTNPARTMHRWEIGERVPPVDIMLKLEQMSGGQVTILSWSQVREAYRQRPPKAA